MRAVERLRSVGVGVAGLVALLAPGCSLEDALGVDDGAATTGDGSGGGPGGGPGPGEADDSGTTGSTGAADTEGGSSDSGPELPPSSCGGRPLRVATYNVESVGAPGSSSFEALAAILGRIDADVVCLQEVQHWETPALFALANATGYRDAIQAEESPAIGGDHTNACMSRGDLRLVGSYSGWDLSSDPTANDVGRHILVVQLDLAAGDASEPCRVGFVALHLKSGQEPLDWFRRQIEVERVAQAVALYQDEHPGDPMVILADLNESLDDPALGTVFTGVPDGLPGSYQVGSDIEFPLDYQPFTRFEGLGFSMVPATQEDSTRDQTWSDAVRLDYVFLSGARLEGSVVYNACRDDGVDAPPEGAWLPLAGEPLPCATSEAASDHFPVVADVTLP
jgi:endonuclease/exonuclease/phosphatase family metal-dependent hydrolase